MVKRTFIFILALIFFTLPDLLQAQELKKDISQILQGHWEGAFIKNNSYQKFDMSVYLKDSTLMSLQVLEEWHPQFGEFQLPLEIDSLGYISFNTGYGRAKTQLDTITLEISGHIIGADPATYVHFKKVPTPPQPDFKVTPIEVKNVAITLTGHLHEPRHAPSKTAIIVVGGRGCYAGSTKYDLTAKLLRQYGVSTVAFNKRGTGNSTGNCDTATMEDLAKDVVAIKKYLEAPPNKFENIGAIGSSAGGWVIMKASELTDLDFLITIVGPSTSVRVQQMQSLEEGIKKFNLSQTARNEAIEYTNLVFDAKPNEKNFTKFQELLKGAETNGWNTLLDVTDIPKNAEDISNLWVRRHDYDPAKAYNKIMVPLLAMYGEKDWIVPYKENTALLEQYYKGDRKKYLKTVLLPEAEHGTEVQEGYRTLPNNHTYWRFFRISPNVQIELIEFLRQNKFLNK